MMIPKNTLAGLKRYAKDRIHPGGFLTAVLENNLRKSFGQADKENREALFEIVCHCYKELPSICWGSPEKVKNWLLGKEDKNGFSSGADISDSLSIVGYFLLKEVRK